MPPYIWIKKWCLRVVLYFVYEIDQRGNFLGRSGEDPPCFVIGIIFSDEMFNIHPLKPAVLYLPAGQAVVNGAAVLEGHVVSQHAAVWRVGIMWFIHGLVSSVVPRLNENSRRDTCQGIISARLRRGNRNNPLDISRSLCLCYVLLTE